MSQETVVKFRDSFYSSHLFYKTVGVRPLFHDTPASPLLSWTFWLSFINLVLTYTGELIYIGISLGDFGTFLNLIALVPCICYVTIALNAMIVVHMKRQRIVNVITQLEEQFPTTIEEQRAQQILKKKRQLNHFLLGYSLAFVVLILTFNFVPFGVTLRGYLKHGTWKKDLPYFMWYPFNQWNDSIFPLIYLHQTWAGFTTVFGMLGEIFLIGSVVVQFSIQFERISMAIVHYKPDPRTDTEFLQTTIRQHNYILTNASEFADIISETLFIQQMASSVVICCVGFQVLVAKDITLIIKFLQFLFCSLMQTFVISFLGHQIMEYVGELFNCGCNLIKCFLPEYRYCVGGLREQLAGR